MFEKESECVLGYRKFRTLSRSCVFFSHKALGMILKGEGPN